MPYQSPPIYPKSYINSYLDVIPSPQNTSKPFSSTNTVFKQTEEQRQLRKQKSAYSAAWMVVKSTITSVLSTFFMLWMTGNSLQIFPLIMLTMSAFTPIKSIWSLSSTFERYEQTGITCYLPKLCFLVLNLISLCGVLWKCNKMNLIPLEWLDYDPYLYAHHGGFDINSARLDLAGTNTILQSLLSIFR